MVVSPGAVTRLFHSLKPRASTPDLTSFSLEDDSYAAFRSEAFVPLKSGPPPTAKVTRLTSPYELPGPQFPIPPVPPVAPRRAAPSAPALLPSSRVSPTSGLRGRPVLVVRTMQDAFDNPPAKQGLQPVGSAHQWLARYLLDEPAGWGPARLLAEDLLGAGILGASATGAAPLVRDDAAAANCPVNEFKAFVESLSAYVASAPPGAQAVYQIAALRVGRVFMGRERSLMLACLGLFELPAAIGQLRHLQILDAGQNRLQSLPESFGNLYALRKVNLVGNLFTAIPPAIESLSIDVLCMDLPQDCAAGQKLTSPQATTQDHESWL